MSAQLLIHGTIPNRLAHTRELMNRKSIHTLLIPSADPHLSEYLPDCWQGQQWLSGFYGSAGTLIVTADFAGVWTDSRYWEQAIKELKNSGIKLVKLHSDQSNPFEWLSEQTPAGAVVAVDGAVISAASARILGDKLAKRGARLRTDIDVLNEVWQDRPDFPSQPIYQHLPPQAAISFSDKLAALRVSLKEKGVDWHFIATLDDIAWLFNLRGSDVLFNPVFLSFVLINPKQVTLFVAQGKINAELRKMLELDGVILRDYSETANALRAVPSGANLQVDPTRVSVSLLENLTAGVKLVEGLNPTTLAKSRKSLAETDHIRRVMEQDGAALCEFFAWLDSALGYERITELTIDEYLTAARTCRPDYVSLSFNTIAAFNANGAMPHYQATKTSNALIEGDGLLLIDSGGQYLGGTTDLTRMVPIGTPSEEQKHDCTRVLKAVIALSCVRFPKGILSPLLDAIARAPIWAEGIDYGHSTGHGVGYFLNVHEGPQVIAYRAATTPQTAMLPGMITSIEPGTYRPGRWGVRIENLVLNRKAGKTEFGEFLKFETLTLCPIDTRCLELSLLTVHEREWFNAYHAEVYARLSPLLGGVALKWLRVHTVAI
ncbi:aminopeptidase P family protein [Candidatus Pseudomonas adelgestsugas]|uniref:Aminopeptidase n=1 Tax=Candidatus Pseudomonas adelgestsugas TaxID=1302376 RepID=A0ABX5R959_9PSED|nr:aminopeptidase P family protein [Candidatus Pseudomonas adelgestsugas]QAX81961.1 Aminopeptidase [Candidatus Pseudomonas adelgestsugas]